MVSHNKPQNVPAPNHATTNRGAYIYISMYKYKYKVYETIYKIQIIIISYRMCQPKTMPQEIEKYTILVRNIHFVKKYKSPEVGEKSGQKAQH